MVSLRAGRAGTTSELCSKSETGGRFEKMVPTTKKETIKREVEGSFETQSASRRRHSKMFHRLSIVIVVLAFSAVHQVPAAAVERSDVPTITVLTTTTLNSATTTTLLTQKVCGIVDNGATACRRKRQFWIDVPILIAQDPETAAYLYQQFQPSPVYAVEPTQLVQYRNSFEQSSAPIDSSLDEVTVVRANVALLGPINTIRTSLLAIATNVINSFLTPVSTFTSVVTGYSTTITNTIVTATKSYTLGGCIPEGVDFTAC